MKRVFTSESAIMAWHVRNVLEQEGIRAEVRNDELYSISGEVPTVECWPEVWVANRLDYDRAERLVRELNLELDGDGPAPETKSWRCAGCGEMSAGNFDICWQCGAPRPDGT